MFVLTKKFFHLLFCIVNGLLSAQYFYSYLFFIAFCLLKNCCPAGQQNSIFSSVVYSPWLWNIPFSTQLMIRPFVCLERGIMLLRLFCLLFITCLWQLKAAVRLNNSRWHKSIWCEIQIEKSKCNLALYYRSPNASESFNKDMWQ